jgi:hypothetical protein
MYLVIILSIPDFEYHVTTLSFFDCVLCSTVGSSTKSTDFGNDLIVSAESVSLSSSFELLFSSSILIVSWSVFTSISTFSSMSEFSISCESSSPIFKSILSQTDGKLSL